MTDSKVLLRLEFSKKVQNSKLKAFLPLTEREREICVFSSPPYFVKGKKDLVEYAPVREFRPCVRVIHLKLHLYEIRVAP